MTSLTKLNIFPKFFHYLKNLYLCMSGWITFFAKIFLNYANNLSFLKISSHLRTMLPCVYHANLGMHTNNTGVSRVKDQVQLGNCTMISSDSVFQSIKWHLHNQGSSSNLWKVTSRSNLGSHSIHWSMYWFFFPPNFY